MKILKIWIVICLIVLSGMWINDRIQPVIIEKEVVVEVEKTVVKVVNTPTDVNGFMITEIVGDEIDSVVKDFPSDSRLFKIERDNITASGLAKDKSAIFTITKGE